ncbi:MAG: DUF4344 domain-containing metallopeptidase [Pseudomonadota bacterium]
MTFQKRLSVVLFAGWLGMWSPMDRPAHAEDLVPSDITIDDDSLFVIGNTLFTLYHELGHALVDLLDLPVIGREEDAVDGFAAVTMIPETPDEVRDALIVAVADGWRVQGDLADDGGERAYWGEHALDEQRHFAIVCLMVGSDQDGFYDYALDAGLPEERIETCSEDFQLMRDSWERLLAPYEQPPHMAETVLGAPITVIFDEPMEQQLRLFDLIRRDGLLEAGVDRFAKRFVLPAPVTIRFAPCNDANAYWSPWEREITICYELIDEYDAILTEGMIR